MSDTLIIALFYLIALAAGIAFLWGTADRWDNHNML